MLRSLPDARRLTTKTLVYLIYPGDWLRIDRSPHGILDAFQITKLGSGHDFRVETAIGRTSWQSERGIISKSRNPGSKPASP